MGNAIKTLSELMRNNYLEDELGQVEAGHMCSYLRRLR